MSGTIVGPNISDLELAMYLMTLKKFSMATIV